jgi:hypothetical protein
MPAKKHKKPPRQNLGGFLPRHRSAELLIAFERLEIAGWGTPAHRYVQGPRHRFGCGDARMTPIGGSRVLPRRDTLGAFGHPGSNNGLNCGSSDGAP